MSVRGDLGEGAGSAPRSDRESRKRPRGSGRYQGWVKNPDGSYTLYEGGVPVARTRPVTQPPPPQTDSPPGRGGGGAGGGGGGGGGGNPAKVYRNYYTRYLNIKPNEKLVQKAVKGNYTMQEFALLVQREDTERFLKTWVGQRTLSNFRTMWARIFPSLGSQPAMKALRLYLKQEPAKRTGPGPGGAPYRNITHPTSMRDMYAFLSRTKLFKKIYLGFKGTKFEQTLDFAGYREYKRQFKRIYGEYLGRSPADSEITAFFKGRIDPGQFEQNLRTMSLGAEAYRYATGGPVKQDQYRRALYAGKGSQSVLAKVAAAYKTREGFLESRPGDFAYAYKQDTGRRVLVGAY